MKEIHEFLMPDYYPSFSCKMGACRSACCVGWPISISLENYYRLIGIDCRRELRRKLDCGLRIIDHPTEDEYARFEPRYDGNCPMRMGDGRCALHAELGEDVLPDVCRLYPRGIRSGGDAYEISCANSCEATLELFLYRTEPIEFIKRDLRILPPPTEKRETYFETFGMEDEVRLYLISIIKNRDYSLRDRIFYLGKILDRMDTVTERGDAETLRKLLAEEITVEKSPIADVTENDMLFGIEVAEKMTEIFDKRSDSIKEYGARALEYFGKNSETLGKYKKASEEFENRFPGWEIFFEHVFVNHIFFSVFPFPDRPESMHSESVALSAVYVLLRFLTLGNITKESSDAELIDLVASAFRLIDHTDFDRYASHLLKKLDCTNEERLILLLSL